MNQRLVHIITGLLFILNMSWAKAQYTLVLIDRPFITADSVNIGPEYLEYRKPGKKKFHAIERDKIFAIQLPDGRESVIYLPDSLEGNWYSAEQMRDYIKGQEDARKGYRRRANRGAIGGVIVGAGASVSRLYGSVVVALYPALVGSLKPAFSERYGFKPEMVENAYYREGYGTMAKRMSTRRAFWGSLTGYVAGTVALIFVFR